MDIVTESWIQGEFDGWQAGAILQLANGQKWRQLRPAPCEGFFHNPKVTVVTDGSHFYLQVEGLDKPIEVKRVEPA